MSSSRPSQSATSSSKTRQSARRIAQTSLDAKLDAEFEECGETFDYSKSVSANEAAPGEHGRSEKVVAYLQHIQRGKLIQPFGCLLALDEKTFRVTAYSENAPEMLTMVSHAVPSVGDHPVLCIGTDVRTLFTWPSTAALQKALGFAEVSLLNPVLVHCKISGKPFYAIMHRVTGSLIVDFEPVEPASMPMTAAGALQSYKLAAKAIAKLQSLPGGSMEKLCNTVVQEVFELTGYDRVMAYKFHDDDHGEVISEMTKPGLDPYLGLHYPATDIPQAARFLFMKNKVRMICDCRAKPVKIHQDESLNFNLTFCGSTLRAPHSCHAQYMENMNSIASLTMGIVINENLTQSVEEEEVGPSEQTPKRKRLWGLIVGHHESPRFIPFPLRYACEFLAQVFAIHVNKEFELENQIREKNILRTQSLLCDMLLKQTTPISIVSSSPNIMDLVKCDGAALVHQKKIYRLGLAPSESQIKDIAYWLVENHMDSTGLSTDSLYEAGYPGALALGDMVSGMAAARINSKDILFWFRAHTANKVQWGGAKHDPSEKDDGRKMHPRSSFRAFLEVVKMRSFPWSDYEMDAIHALQLILRATPSGTTVGTIGPDMDGAGIILERRVEELKLESMVELQAVTNEMVRLIETATVPILAVDGNGLVNGWNQKIAELTGLIVEEAIGKHLLSLVDDDSSSRVENMLYSALQGQEEQNVQFELKTHGSLELSPPITLIANTCSSRDTNNNIVGACFIAQDITTQKSLKDQFTRIEGDYKSIVQNPNPLIPPIFGSDEFGWCTVWNPAMSTLTGWHRNDIIDKMLLGEVFGGHGSCCRMKNQDAFINLSVVINNAMTGKDKEKSPFGFYTRNKKFIECFLSVSKKVDSEGIVTGVFCFLHIMSNELQNVIKVEQISEQTVVKRLKALDYIKNEARNPLSGMLYFRKMIEGTELNEEQNRLLCMAASCQRQLSRVLDDLDVESFADSSFDLDMVEFELKDVVMTAVSQVLVKGQERGVRIIYDLAQWFVVDPVYGDGLRLQQIISNFLAVSVKFSPSGGLVEVGFSLVKDPIGKTLELIRLEISIMHTGSGIPENLLSQMFGNEEDSSEEGLGLFVCRKLLKLMNGDVRYVREASKSSFNISVELGSSPPEPMKTVL